MENLVSTLFYLRKSKKDRHGNVPIYIRITVNGKRLELSTHRKIRPSQWDSNLNQASATAEKNIILNNYLSGLKSKVYKQCNIIESLGERITIDNLKNRLSGTSQKKHTLLEIFRHQNELVRQKVGPEFSLVTYKHYKASFAKVEAFIKYQYRKSDINLDDLKHHFVTSFELYLKNQANCGHNTAMKHIIRLKKVVNLALFNEWITRNPFTNFRCSMHETNRGYLNAAELQDLQEKDIRIKRIDKVRDIFIFCCYTGLSWADVQKLSADDITLGIDGERWIITTRKKNNNRTPVPILPQAQAILDKYKNDPAAIESGKLLPVSSNQKMNVYLKEIGDITGITKNLTMHLARHTFATTVTLANGVPIETVSKMLGHTSIKTTQIYSKVVDTKISHDMQALKAKLSEKPEQKSKKAV